MNHDEVVSSFRRFSASGHSGPEGEPLLDSEPYGRVTAPDRYAVLHALGEATLLRLASVYAVERTEGPAASTELAGLRGVVRAVRLRPVQGAGAPRTVAFLSFPGLIVRAGRWHKAAFPACGCDGCAEDPAALSAEFSCLVEAVVAGQFQEAVELPWVGPASATSAYGDDAGVDGRLAGSRVVSRREARTYRRSRPPEVAGVPGQSGRLHPSES